MADFDANGRRDLLFVQFFLGNGRCLDELVVTSFLFDQNGRPIPWRIVTHGFRNYDDGLLTLLDEDGDGKAELATCGCKYSGYPKNGEDRRLTSIYEAGDALWRPLQPLSLSPYVLRFQQERPHTGDFIVWEVPDTVWSDPHAGWDGEDRTLEAVSGSGDKAVLHFQDGPSRPIADAVVIEGPAGREILLQETDPASRRILTADARVRLLGNGERPSAMWALLDSDAAPAALTARMEYRAIETNDLRSAPAPGLLDSLTAWVTGEPTKPWAPTVTFSQGYFSLDSRCYRLYHGAGNDMIVELLDDCAEFQALRSDAIQGKRVRIINTQWDVKAWVLDTQSRRFSNGDRIGVVGGRSIPVEIQCLEGRPGELIAVVPRGDGFLAQWRLGSRTWLTLHDESGAPISPAIDPEIDGELFLLDQNSGKICFLRWDANDPVYLTCARANVEVAREP